jgi:dipeptidyl aminopeptidase/acylaminoacyl peptidase
VLCKDGMHVALRRYSAGRSGRGADLTIRNLEQGTEVSFGNVADFAWSDEGALLGMTIDVDSKIGNGVQLFDAATGSVKSLDAVEGKYSNLVWRPHSADLVVLRSRTDSAFADTSEVVIAWRALGSPKQTKALYDFTADNAFPKGMRVASYRAPQWSDDGSTLFFGIAPREPKASSASRGSAQPARVEVWHWKDLREYHQQDRQSAQDRTKTHLAAWNLASNKLARLADDSIENVQLSANGKAAIATDEDPYFTEIISGRQYRDVYRVDVATGKREKVVSKSPFGANISPDGRYVMYTQGGHWWSYDLSSGARANVTAKVASVFMDMEDDHPVAERRPYGQVSWVTGGKSVLLYDRFDVWQVNADGSNPVRLTRGKEDSTVYRVQRLDPEARTVDLAKPVILTATGEWNKKSGFARLTGGQVPQRLLWVDKNVGRLEKADNADVYSYVTQTYSESPNLFVSTGALTDGKQISRTNAFLSEFAWGKQELMEYTNSHGDKLQMMLTYPADYEPGKKYPMVVYYYEKLSQGFHQFVVPTERATYNTSVFSQHGYFVLRPDIVFRPREAGPSGLDCVTSAVKAALATGMIDPKRVGNMGHSWGGYQSAFYAVHGKGMFAATIAGAPLTNFISMYGYTSFNTGSPETGHFETGQERMQVSLWEDPQAYIRNSTVFAVDSLQTPLLLEEGDADGNVNYWQSMELYNFGRRLGKQVVFLLYNDENHGVARPESQIDYRRRQLEWFDHFLKGAPAPDWITRGETYLERQKLLKQGTGADDARGGSVIP